MDSPCQSVSIPSTVADQGHGLIAKKRSKNIRNHDGV